MIETPKMGTLCPECGPDVEVDEDGCCRTCGGNATGAYVDGLTRAAFERINVGVSISHEGGEPWPVFRLSRMESTDRDTVERYRAAIERCVNDRGEPDRTAIEALRGLVSIIDAAGLLNLSRGVELGPTAWYVKASDRMEFARAELARLDHPGGLDGK